MKETEKNKKLIINNVVTNCFRRKTQCNLNSVDVSEESSVIKQVHLSGNRTSNGNNQQEEAEVETDEDMVLSDHHNNTDSSIESPKKGQQKRGKKGKGEEQRKFKFKRLSQMAKEVQKEASTSRTRSETQNKRTI